jgi:predicted transcriptional regulator
MSLESREKKSRDGQKPQILNYIRIHPGSSFKTIQSVFNIPESTLRYYVKDLEKKGQIRSKSNKRIYYPMEQQKENTLTDIQNQLIYHIKKQPNMNQKELIKITKLNRSTVSTNIKILVEKELIKLEKIGKEIRHKYIYPKDLEKEKLLRLITKFLTGKIDEETYWDMRRRYNGEDGSIN